MPGIAYYALNYARPISAALVNTVTKAHLFAAVFSQLSIFTADCLRHPIQMTGIETVWELHTLTVMNS